MPAPGARLFCLLWTVLLSLVVSLHASDGGFAATLSSEKQTAAGLTELSPVERLVLDQLVAGELAAVRRGDAPELAGTFVSRRTAAEREAAGLDRLTPAQLGKLDEYAAAALAARAKPKERPRLKDSDVLADAKRPEIHGSVSVAYGTGRGGRDMWAQSLWLDYYDPESRVGIGIGLSNFNGSGYYGFYPDALGYGYDGGRYYGPAPLLFETSYRGGSRGDPGFGDGQSFCGGGGGRSYDLLGRRGH